MASRTLELILKVVSQASDLEKLKADLQALGNIQPIEIPISVGKIPDIPAPTIPPIDIPAPKIGTQEYVKLAQALNLSYAEAKKLSDQLGLAPEKIEQAIGAMRQFNSVKLDAKMQFEELNKTLGITQQQFDSLKQKASGGGIFGAFKDLGSAFSGGGSLVDQAAKLGLAFTGVGGAVQGVVGAVQGLASAGQGAFNALITSNEQLNQQLLQSAASITANARVLQGGVEITDPRESILALQEPLKKAIKDVELSTQSLVGVTSETTNTVFNTILTNVGLLNNQFKDLKTGAQQFKDPLDAAAKLAPGLVATLGTLGLPIAQASDEIGNLLRGEIDQTAQVAKSLGITRDMVNNWKAQGTLVSNLVDKFKPFIEANKLASLSISGIKSNIEDIIQTTARTLGEPLLEPLVQGLNQVYLAIQANQEGFTKFFQGVIRDAKNVAGNVISGFKPIGDALISAFTLVTPVLGEATKAILQVVNVVGTALKPALTIIGGAFQQAFQNAQPYFEFLTNLFTLAASGLQTLTNALNQGFEQIAGASEDLRAKFKPVFDILDQIGEKAKETLGLINDVLTANSAAGAADQIANISERNKVLSQEAITAAQKLKALNDITKAGGKLTEDQISEKLRLTKQLKEVSGELDANAEALQNVNATTKDTQNARDTEIQSLNSLKNTLGAVTGQLEIQSKKAPELGNSYAQLAKQAQQAKDKLGQAQNTQEADAAAKQLIDATKQQLELGQISAEQAQKTFEDLAKNTQLSVSSQQAAAKEVTGVKKSELDQQKADVDAQIAEIEAAVKSGQKGEVQGAQEITKLKSDQLQKQLEDVRKQIAEQEKAIASGFGSKSELEKLKNQEKQLNAQVDSAEIEGRERVRKAREAETQDKINQINNQISATELAAQKGEITEVESAKRITEFKKQQLDLQLKDLDAAIAEEEKLIKAGQGSKERLEDLKTQRQKTANDREKETIEGEKRVQAARLNEIQRAEEKATQVATEAETNRNIEIQKLQNAGVITKEEANKRQLESTKRRLQAELAAEKASLSRLQALPPSSNPEEERKRQNDIAASRKRTADLTLQILQNEASQQQAVIDAAEKAARKQVDIVKRAALERQIATQQAVNQGKLLEESAARQRTDDRKKELEAELAAEIKVLEDIQKIKGIDKTKVEEQQNKIQQLRLQLLESEKAAQEAITAEVRARIDREFQKEKIALEGQAALLDAITKSYENQQKVLAAKSELQQSLSNLAKGEYDIAINALEGQFAAEDKLEQRQKQRADLRKQLVSAKSPEEIKSAQEALANLDKQEAREKQLQALRIEAKQAELAALNIQQQLEAQSLLLEQQKTVALQEQERIRIRISELEAKAELAKVKADPNARPEQVQAAEQRVQLTQQAKAAFEQGVQATQAQFAVQRQALTANQKLTRDKATLELNQLQGNSQALGQQSGQALQQARQAQQDVVNGFGQVLGESTKATIDTLNSGFDSVDDIYALLKNKLTVGSEKTEDTVNSPAVQQDQTPIGGGSPTSPTPKQLKEGQFYDSNGNLVDLTKDVFDQEGAIARGDKKSLEQFYVATLKLNYPELSKQGTQQIQQILPNQNDRMNEVAKRFENAANTIQKTQAPLPSNTINQNISGQIDPKKAAEAAARQVTQVLDKGFKQAARR